MFVPFASVCTLLLLAFATLNVQARHHYRHFAISVHLPIEGNCKYREELQDKKKGEGTYIRDPDCKNLPEFRAFKYYYSPVRYRGESSYRYGICPVSFFSKDNCQGERLLFVDDGNNVDNFGGCWDTDVFNRTAGRSVKVGPCRMDGHRPPEMPHPPEKPDA